MSRFLAVLVLLVLPAAGSGQPPGVEEPEDPEALADIVGTWVAEGRDLSITLGVILTIDNGALAGELMGNTVQEGGPPFTEARMEGDRIELVTEAEEGEEPGRLLLQRTRRGLRLVRASFPYRRVRGRPTLTRRDQLWYAMRLTLRDLAHDAGDHDPQRLVAATEAVREGVQAAGRAAILSDLDEAICLIDLATSSPVARIRARAHALAQAAGRGSVCDVDRATMSPGEAGPTASGCARVTIADDDGQTTLRGRPSARSEARGTVANGTTLRVDDRRGRWLYLGDRRGWVHRSNVRCQP
jgi:hypothetical protein